MHQRFKSSQARGTRDSEAEPDPPRRPPRRGVGSLNRRRFLQGGAAIAAGASPARLAQPPDRRPRGGNRARGPRSDRRHRRPPVRLLTYNGLFPGPLIRAREGQSLRVRLTNRLAEPTNLHFHGVHVSPEDHHDNVFVSLPPGQSFTYEITVPEGYGGTFWYHPHRHGRLARQLWQGLAGPLVIDPARRRRPLPGSRSRCW